jgi:hypothetical protein
MFATEQLNELKSRVQNAFRQAHGRASAFEQEARKVLETLGDRAQAEVKVLIQHAQATSRGQLGIVGAELEKLGKRLRLMAEQPRHSGPTKGAAPGDGNSAPVSAPTVQ